MTTGKKIIVIGGSAAGPKAAARARRLDQNADIVIIQKEPDLSMASCGYPYYVGGFIKERNQLLSTGGGTIRNPLYYWDTKGITAKTETEVTRINTAEKSVECRNLVTNKTEVLAYHKLIIATGSASVIPNIPGKNLKGITTLKSMRDVDFLRSIRDEGVIQQAVVIGGGLIGIETCEALQSAGIETVLVELEKQILTFLDRQLAMIIESYLRTRLANVITNNGVAQFIGERGTLTAVELSDGIRLPCELAIISIGVQPNNDLARSAGLQIGQSDGIIVDRYMQTSDPAIYAIGDCTEQYHLITGRGTYAPFGDLANLEGRVAGENAVMGNTVTFPGSIHSGICKIFDYTAGSTGLSETRARAAGRDNVTSVVVAGTDKPGFMRGQLLISKIIADNQSRRIIGFQCVGPGNVSKQVAQAAIAIQAHMTVNDLVNLDLPYAPPFTLAIDNFIVCAHVLENKLKGHLKGISAEEVMNRITNGENSYFLDVRGLDEFKMVRLGIGETLIPLDMLRKQLHKLPPEKNRGIIVYCKTGPRSYEAALFLEHQGWENVKVMEGGITAWPYPLDK